LPCEVVLGGFQPDRLRGRHQLQICGVWGRLKTEELVHGESIAYWNGGWVEPPENVGVRFVFHPDMVRTLVLTGDSEAGGVLNLWIRIRLFEMPRSPIILPYLVREVCFAIQDERDPYALLGKVDPYVLNACLRGRFGGLGSLPERFWALLAKAVAIGVRLGMLRAKGPIAKRVAHDCARVGQAREGGPSVRLMAKERTCDEVAAWRQKRIVLRTLWRETATAGAVRPKASLHGWFAAAVAAGKMPRPPSRKVQVTDAIGGDALRMRRRAGKEMQCTGVVLPLVGIRVPPARKNGPAKERLWDADLPATWKWVIDRACRGFH
jgi:hypothetical protein